MSDLIANAGEAQPTFKRAVAAAGVANTSDGDTADLAPNWTTGSGVPSSSQPDGSLYTRKDATDGDDFLYGRVAGAWVPILGETA